MRVLALDYGAKTVGVAVTDALGLTAQPVETIRRPRENVLRKTYNRIGELILEKGAELIVVGLPLNMDETEGERAALARRFGEAVSKRSGIPVVFFDERLTSVEAEEILRANGVKTKDRGAVIDQVAACLILRGYLETKEKNGKTDI